MRWLGWLGLWGALASCGGGSAAAQDGLGPSPKREPVVAPSLEGGVAWFNAAEPLTWKRLRGKIVLVDFWTFGCVNCHHVFPGLARLEATYRQELVVIGVHSAKFDHERVTRHIRAAVDRFGMRHPVVNDARREIWQRWNVRTWPTIALVDPEGMLVGAVIGEGQEAVLEDAIRATIDTHAARGTLQRGVIEFGAEPPADTPLRFPGKVCIAPDPPRLCIADTNHHRVLVAGLDGRVQAIIGDGTPGHADGIAPTARFRSPQGLCATADTLWVADTENHMIRQIDLRSLQVSTLAGTGAQIPREGGGDALTTPLNSPWDLALDPGRKALFIAMAGQHQIWAYALEPRVVAPFAGDRQERLRDGSAGSASFNQPCGLALVDDRLYIADCEASALRVLDLGRRRVDTLVGTGLFDWGDADGVGTAARLQHPLHVAWDGARARLLIVDAYNHKLKAFDPATQAVTTVAGDGTAGASDHPARFWEPGGCAVWGDRCYVADTNNHAIRVVDAATGAVTTLTLTGLPARK